MVRYLLVLKAIIFGILKGREVSRGVNYHISLASHQSALLLSCMKAATLIGGMQAFRNACIP